MMISRTLFFAVIKLLFCGLLIIGIPYSDIQTMYTLFAVISLFELLFIVICNTKQTKQLVNFSFIFVLCLYLFTFGQVVLMGLFPQACEELTIVLRYFDNEELILGLRWLNTAFVLVGLGILLANDKEGRTYSIQDVDNVGYDYLRSKAILMIGLTFPVKLIVDIIILYAGFQSGFSYATSVLRSIPDVIVSYGSMSTIGFALLIISLKERKTEQLITFAAIVAYTLGIMSVGRRSEGVAYLCIYILCFCNGKKFNVSKIAVYAIFGYLVLTFLNSVVRARSTDMGIVDAFWYTLTKRNMVFEALREYGNTAYTALSVIIKWLPSYGPTYGKSYYLGLTAIFPNIGGIMGKLTRLSNYGFVLQESNVLSVYYQNIGGSVLGEFFYNFGFVGACIASLIFGVVVGKISMRASAIMNQTTSYKMVYYLAVMPGVLYWIRDYFSGISRDIVWGLLFVLVIKKVIAGKSINQKIT